MLNNKSRSLKNDFNSLITGKCTFFKGVKLGDIILVNLLVIMIFITPMCIESIIALSVFVVVLANLIEVVILGFNRFDNACNCVVESGSKTDPEKNNTKISPTKTARIRPHSRH
jgi:hypothetical protein